MEFDAVVIGAGHNGLTCAYYLAKKGHEGRGPGGRRHCRRRGGDRRIPARLPQFSAASYTVSLLKPKVIRDLQLERHGLKVVLRKTDNFLPGDGDYLLSGRGGLTRKEIARHVKADGEAYDRYIAELEDGRPAAEEMAAARAAQCRAQGQRDPQAAEPRPRHGRAVARRNPHRPRFRGAQRGRNPRPPFRGRSGQGAVRLRRRRRQFRVAASAGHGLRPAPPSVRRSGRRARAPGAMRSAAWARSPRRWRARAARRASTSCSTRRSRK